VSLHQAWLAASVDERAAFVGAGLADFGEALLLRAYRHGTADGLRALVPMAFALRRLGQRLDEADHGPSQCDRCGEPLTEDNTDLEHESLCDYCGYMLEKELAA
jgi:hypothetical protein